MATKTQLRDRAANELGLLPIGQTLASQHQTRIESGYDEIYAMLKTEGLNTWPSDGSCATELVPHVASLIAESCLNTYQVSVDRYSRIKVSASIAMREIRKLTQPEYESVEEATDF